MLKTLRLHNFRTYLDAQIHLTERHLLIGRNNSGKTNLYAALGFLRDSARQDLLSAASAIPGGIAEITNWALDSNVIQMSCACDLPFDGTNHEFVYQLELGVETVGPSPTSRIPQVVPRVRREELCVHSEGYPQVALLWSNGSEATILNEGAFMRTRQDNQRSKAAAPPDATMLSKLYDWEANPKAVFFRAYLSSWRFFALNPEAIRRRWQDARMEIFVLDPDGANLAIVLYQIKNFDNRRYRGIMDHVRRIEPELEEIGFVPPVQGQVPRPFVEFRRKRYASWDGLSDGTLRYLALAVLAESVARDEKPPPRWVAPLAMIEEPENGIYPGQVRELLELFEERGAAGQFIFTSHSPYFINLFDGQRESVTVLRRNNERTEVRPIPAADDSDPDRPLLAEQFSMDLFD